MPDDVETRWITQLVSPLLLLLALALAGGLTGCAAEPKGFFPITYWCPPPAEDARYKEAADAGFNLAFNGDLDLAQKYNMKCLVADPRVIAAVNKPGPETDKGLDAAVAEHAKHPAFWGFYLKDEPSATKFDDLAHVNQYLLAKAPDCVPFINLFPTYASQKQLGTPTYAEHVERFMTEVKPRVLSYDHYALMEGGTEREDYFRNMEIIRAAGLKHDVPTWFIFLITPHFNYRDPSEGDLRWQVYTALTYGYKGLAYFTYWGVNDKRFGEAIISRDGKRTGRYYLASKINAEINAVGPLLATLTSRAVYHFADELPEGTHGPDKGSWVQRAEGGDVVLGELVGPTGKTYLFVSNASPRRDVNVRLTFAEGVSLIGERRRGPLLPDKIVPESKPAGMILSLMPGDGRLFELDVRSPAGT